MNAGSGRFLVCLIAALIVAGCSICDLNRKKRAEIIKPTEQGVLVSAGYEAGTKQAAVAHCAKYGKRAVLKHSYAYANIGVPNNCPPDTFSDYYVCEE
jgi:hypothetical protein